jgi:hypothetical protein
MNINNEQASMHSGDQQPDISHLKAGVNANKIRSKDLMPQTGNKCNDLFELSKHMK